MKAKYRIHNTVNRKQIFESDNNPCVGLYNIKYRIIQTYTIFIIGTIFLGILSGCGSNLNKPKEGYSEIQIAAFEILNQSLNSSNPIIKVNAIEIAATLRLENYLPTINKSLQDPSVPVRFAAAVAIGEMQYPLAANSINQCLTDRDPNVAIAASYAMSRIGYPDYIQVLRESLKSNNNQIMKANSALLLGKSSDRNSLNLLYELMNDPDSSEMVSYQAAEAIAMLGDERIFETIWAMLINLYADIRFTGVKAMGELGTPQAEDALVTMLKDPVMEIRIAAAEQLGKLNNNKGKNAVLEVLKKKLYMSQDFQSQERILTLSSLAIGEIGTRSLTKFLPGLLKNESPIVRLAAAKAVIQTSSRL